MVTKEQRKANYNFKKNIEEKRNLDFANGRIWNSGTLTLGSDNWQLGILEGLLSKQYDISRFRYYKSVKCDIIDRRYYALFNSDLKRTFYSALLSDNAEMQQAVADESLLPNNRDVDPNSDKPIEDYPVKNSMDTFYQYDKGLQAVLSGNNDQLEACVKRLKELQKAPDIDYRDLVDIETRYLEAMLDGTHDVVNNALEYIYKKRNVFNYGDPPQYDDLYCHDLCGMAKLAVIKGIEVDLDVPQVPRDLLEIKPLEEYESPEWLDVLYYEGREAYEKKYMAPNEDKSNNNKKGGFFKKWL